MKHGSFLRWAGLVLAVLAASCSTTNVGTNTPGQLDDQRGGSGVKLGGFEVIRRNSGGYADASLNRSITLRNAGDSANPALQIVVDDTTFTTTVALDVKYDPQSMHPVGVDFHGLLGNDAQVLSASFLSKAGKAGVGQAAIGDYRPGALSGRFATLRFENGPMRNASAAGDVGSNELGVGDVREGLDNLNGDSDTVAGTASVQWTSQWLTGDGDINGEVSISDITPIALNFDKLTTSDWSGVIADYDEDQEVGIADITPIALHYDEVATSYLVQASDNVDGATRSDVATLLWDNDMNQPLDPANPAGSKLEDVFGFWKVDFGASSTFTYTQLADLDAATDDGLVRLYVTPVNDGAGPGNVASGVEAFVELTVGSTTPPLKTTITIGGYTIKVTGASGGAGTGGDEFNSTSQAGAVPANGSVGASLLRISGTYNSEVGTGNFDGTAAFPADMTQADYDLAFNAARDQAIWEIGHAGAAGFRHIDDWLVYPQAFPMTGDPAGTGLVFPDWDPESDASTGPAEGSLTVTVPQEGIGQGAYPDTADLNVNVLSNLITNFAFDVEQDTAAPEVVEIMGDAGQLLEIPLLIDSTATLTCAWGSNGAPPDLSVCQLELWQFDNSGLPSTGAGNPYVFDTFVATNPVNAGEFTVRDLAGTPSVIAVISGANLTSGAHYHMRFNDGTTWSTVNLPDWMQDTKDPPQAQPLIVIPDVIESSQGNIILMYSDPMIRRIPQLQIDIINSTVNPLDDLGFPDGLKASGDEFLIELVSGEAPYPHLAWKETSDPNTITPADTDPAMILVERNPHRIVLGTTGLPNPDAGNPTLTFSVKMYGKNDLPLGQATFDEVLFKPATPNPIPINWGVNLFPRDDDTVDLVLRDYTTCNGGSPYTVDSQSVGTARPDVIWVELMDGKIDDTSAILNGFHYETLSNNVRLRLIDTLDDSTYDLALALRVAGLGSGNTSIMIHPLQRIDYKDIGGIFYSGGAYEMHLWDPSKSYDVLMTNNLTVINDPPPFP